MSNRIPSVRHTYTRESDGGWKPHDHWKMEGRDWIVLKTEMERFRLYYSKGVLPQLLIQINKIYEKIGNSTGKFYKLSVDHITD